MRAVPMGLPMGKVPRSLEAWDAGVGGTHWALCLL